MKLQPGDIIIVRGRGLFSRLIRWASRGHERVRATHVALAVSEATVVEALPGGVVERAYRSGDVYRPLTLTQYERRRIADHARRYVGRPYGWGKIVLHALGLGRFATLDRYPICSWIVASAYASEGYTFGVSHRGATPDDIEDFVAARPDKYERLPR